MGEGLRVCVREREKKGDRERATEGELKRDTDGRGVTVAQHASLFTASNYKLVTATVLYCAALHARAQEGG